MNKNIIAAVLLSVFSSNAFAATALKQLSADQTMPTVPASAIQYTIVSGLSGPDQNLLIEANKNAREKMTAVLNYHRKNAGLPEVSADTVFSRELILDGTIVKTYPLFRSLGDLKAFMFASPKVQEVGEGMGMAMGYTFSKLGAPSALITEKF